MTALIQGAGTPLRQLDLPDGAAVCRRSVDAWVGNALSGVTGPRARITFLLFRLHDVVEWPQTGMPVDQAPAAIHTL